MLAMSRYKRCISLSVSVVRRNCVLTHSAQLSMRCLSHRVICVMTPPVEHTLRDAHVASRVGSSSHVAPSPHAPSTGSRGIYAPCASQPHTVRVRSRCGDARDTMPVVCSLGTHHVPAARRVRGTQPLHSRVARSQRAQRLTLALLRLPITYVGHKHVFTSCVVCQGPMHPRLACMCYTPRADTHAITCISRVRGPVTPPHAMRYALRESSAARISSVLASMASHTSGRSRTTALLLALLAANSSSRRAYPSPKPPSSRDV